MRRVTLETRPQEPPIGIVGRLLLKDHQVLKIGAGERDAPESLSSGTHWADIPCVRAVGAYGDNPHGLVEGRSFQDLTFSQVLLGVHGRGSRGQGRVATTRSSPHSHVPCMVPVGMGFVLGGREGPRPRRSIRICPRARMPRMLPLGKAAGKAGSRSSRRGCDDTSMRFTISGIAPLASTLKMCWFGSCEHIRLGYMERRMAMITTRP
ncbi:MAG: hypothetical protein AMS16_00580 [Planctomycetes bacterium DG_58]|nr:MAG: hypothetical protein AMS16_00580 [Planctomycetes bacterium DG_58]KPK49872.1 MAG: hypothetical protein AMK72_03520 [Planctomycetes bacterium SM23_25]